MSPGHIEPGTLPTYAELLRREDAPPGSAWGLFGADDQLGALNLLRYNDLRAAAGQVQDGRAYSLDLRSDAIAPPLAPTRRPLLHTIFQRTPFHRDDWVDSFYLQYGTQVDGLRHIGHPDHGFYNGADPAGFQPGTGLLSIHHFAELPIAGRAVLIDVDRYLRSTGVQLDHANGQPVPVDVLEAARAYQGTAICPGDILMVRFGWLDYYLHHSDGRWRDNLVNDQRHTGLLQGHDTLAWLWDNRISMVAADNFAFECWPAQPGTPFLTTEERAGATGDPHRGIMHRNLIGLLGMPIGELWNLDSLAAACASDGRYSILLTVSPLPLVGGVGSPANATAIR